MNNILNDDLSEMYRQRGRWFLLLGVLLGGIVTLATALGFWLENWGHHIGGGPGEDARGIGVGFGVALTVLVIVIALLVWRARVLLVRSRSARPANVASAPGVPSVVNSAVAAWTSSVLTSHPSPHQDTRPRPDGQETSSTQR